MTNDSEKPGSNLRAILIATLVVYGGLVLAVTLLWRQKLRDEVLRREAETIHAVAQMQLAMNERRLAAFGGREFVIDDMWEAVLKSSKLKRVLGVQLFDARSRLRNAAPIAPDDVESSVWWPRQPDRAAARFVREGSWEMVSPLLALRHGVTARIAVLDVAVPLRDDAAGGVLAVARYWINASGEEGEPSVAREFTRTDRVLMAQAGAALFVGLLLAWGFLRLAETNRRLQAQSADLARANEELDFAAKTGALGAISAHLIHGLKNPLAGIEGFVADNLDNRSARGEAWRAAMETTQRLRAMVNEVTTVLRDETGGASDYDVPVSEVVGAARIRALPLAEHAGIELAAMADGEVEVPARAANLAGLVLANLLANAIEATPRRGRVRLEGRGAEGGAEFLVSDSGGGLPEEVRAALFRPVRSSKRGGGGVGLAISYRLAKHAGGDLALVRSDARGSVFRLFVPIAAPV
jgi:signal transduction histidine kinase